MEFLKEKEYWKSFEILHSIFEISILPLLKSLLDRGIKIRILVYNTCEYFQIKVNSVIDEKPHDGIRISCLDRLGRFNEMILISDSKYVLQMRYDDDNKMVASFTNENHKVQVQAIIFEKFWNELTSLSENMDYHSLTSN